MLLRPRWRRVEWILYMGANLLTFLSKHSLVAPPLQSIGRYVLVLFPGFILLGDWLSGLSSRWRQVYLLLSSLLLVLFSCLYVLAVFIG